VASHRFEETGTMNGFPDPGETVRIPVSLFNSGVEAATATGGTLSLADPAQGTVLDDSATWNGPSPSDIAESEDPHFEVEVAESVTCGEILAFDVRVSAANATARTERFSVRLGDPSRDFPQTDDLVVPSDPAGPFASTLDVDQDWTIAEVDVSVDVTQPNEEDLIVELTSPEGTTVRLQDRSTLGFGIHERYDQTRPPDGPGSMDDFVGESTAGTWTLTVEDAGTASYGDSILNEWTLHLTVNEGFDCVPATCSEPPPTTAPVLTLRRVFDGASYDLEFDWTAVAGVAGYRILQSPVATFDSDVTVLAEPGAGETTFVMDEPATPDVLFFVVRGLNSCGEEGP
jgi:subtilisin-like proprotein convertase family protein